MTVKELVKELKGYDKDAEVYFVKDWERVDEQGVLTAIAPLRSVSEQIEIVDTGLGFDDIHEVLLEFDMEG